MSKRTDNADSSEDDTHKHIHHHGASVHEAHSRLHKQSKRAVGDLVTATIDGAVVHWTNE